MFVIPMLIRVLLLAINEEHHNVYCTCYLATLVARYVSVLSSVAQCCTVLLSWQVVPTRQCPQWPLDRITELLLALSNTSVGPAHP